MDISDRFTFLLPGTLVEAHNRVYGTRHRGVLLERVVEDHYTTATIQLESGEKYRTEARFTRIED